MKYPFNPQSTYQQDRERESRTQRVIVTVIALLLIGGVLAVAGAYLTNQPVNKAANQACGDRLGQITCSR